MAPEQPRLPFRWAFDPVVSDSGFVFWRWCAYDQAGRLVMESDQRFETYTECVQDAKLRGYIEPERR